jgi:hypothetical protein
VVNLSSNDSTVDNRLDGLTAIAGKRVAASLGWPKSLLALSRELRRIAPQMRLHDISIIFDRTRRSHLITITKINRRITEASHVSLSEIESCFDELTDGQKSVTP